MTRRQAEQLASDARASSQPLLVAFARSSPDARALLRERGVSYAAGDGEIFVLAPPVYVERPARRRVTALPGPAPTTPFATRSSRVPRWLLLHVDERPTIRLLSQAVDLSEATVSRAVQALAEDGLAAVHHDPDDARRRRVRVRDAGALLDAFERAVATRRHRRVTWDVGARDSESALTALRDAATHLGLPYAVGGVAGAAFLRRAVDPADVTLWIAADDVDRWAGELVAAPSRPGPGRITAHLAADPFTLTLATEHSGIRVADPVQLYLDCRRSGERALEAADAVREEMRW
ncbi:MAG: hypothetical protein AB1416_12315 [Actinomycetota bacterium]